MKQLEFFLRLITAIFLCLFLAAYFCNAVGVPHLFLTTAVILFITSCVPISLPSGSLGMAINAKDILFGQGKFNPGGTADYISYAFVDDIDTWPAAFANFENTDLAVTYASLIEIPVADPFVMKVGKYFYKLYCTQETGEVKSTMIGPVDSRAWQNEGDGSFPDNDDDFLGFLAAIANRKIVAIWHESNGKSRVIGFPKYPAQVAKADSTSGKKVDDGRATVYSFMAKGGVPAPVYKAPVPYAPVV